MKLRTTIFRRKNDLAEIGRGAGGAGTEAWQSGRSPWIADEVSMYKTKAPLPLPHAV